VVRGAHEDGLVAVPLAGLDAGEDFLGDQVGFGAS
jgi:hypothetical protein